MNKIELEKIKFSAYKMLDKYELDAQWNVDYDQTTERVILDLKHYIWAEQLQRIEIIYPDGWWNAVKDRWLPEWAKSKWPVEYKKHRWDVKALYPDYRPKVQNEKYIIAFME